MAKANTYPARTLVNVYGEDVNGAFGKAAVILNNFTATTNPTTTTDNTQGFSIGSYWFNKSTGRLFIARDVTTNAAVWVPLKNPSNDFIVNNWHLPITGYNLTTGAAVTAGTISLFRGYFRERATLSNLGVRVSTVSAGGNVQAAVYADNPATARPTGTALVSTASMSTASAAVVSAAAAIQLNEGWYWWAMNVDNSVAAFIALASNSSGLASDIGSATLTSVLNANPINGLSVTQTFGTWPDLTSGSFTEKVGAATINAVAFEINSVP